jgi:hypothetical protein
MRSRNETEDEECLDIILSFLVETGFEYNSGTAINTMTIHPT